jgi:hypothetical protein
MALPRNLGTHHAWSATTAGYVKRLGRRPQTVAQRAAAILDGDLPPTRTLARGFGITPAT